MLEDKIKLAGSLCTGCVSCVASCPANAIKMISDEHGYFVPEINHDRCNKCGKCLEVCPIISPRMVGKNAHPTLYAFQTNVEGKLRGCSSGGAFRLIAESFLREKGCVVGATWNGHLTCDYMILDSEKDLWKIQKTKYMEPRMSLDLMIQIRELLKEGKRVLFSGLPCHVAGLYSFLNEEYDNLYTVDVFCEQAPSSTFFKKHLADAYGEKVTGYSFRDKSTWCEDTSSTKCVYEDKYGNRIEKYTHKVEEDNFQIALQSRIMCPHHCEKCTFAGVPRFADISIGDFKGFKELHPELVNEIEKGVSAVLINNEHGRELLDGIDKGTLAIFEQRDIEDLKGNGFINVSPKPVPEKRDVFYEKILTESFSEALIASDVLPKPKKLDISQANLFFNHEKDHFEFNKEDFEEHVIKGFPTMFVKEEKSISGIRFYFPLKVELNPNKRYRFEIRFKSNTTSPSINFNLINDEGAIQVIGSMSMNNVRNMWVDLENVFIPESKNSKFMVGAVQLTGEDAFIAVDSISIIEI